MKKILKFIVFIILVVLLAITAFVFTFDANNYKPEIIAQVEQQTGRDFNIDGDIGLSVFPWVGLKVEDVSLGNAPGFSDVPMVELSQLDIKVMLLPLLKKEVQVDRVRLHGLSVSLETDGSGKTNWADLAQPPPQKAEPVVKPEAATEAPVEKQAESGMALAGLMINGVEFIDANIHWQDARSGMKAKVSALSLETGKIAFDRPVDVAFSAWVESNQPEVEAKIVLAVRVQFNEALNRFTATDLDLNVETLMQALSQEKITLELNTDAAVDLEQQSASLSQTSVSALGATLNAELDITGLNTSPRISGRLSTDGIDPRALAAKLQIELPPMAGANSLKRVALSSRLKATPSSVALDEFMLEFDQSQLSGWLHVPDIAQPAVRYQLALDAIKLDDYLPPPPPEEGGQEKAGKSAAGKAGVAANEVPADIEIPLPVDLLRQLDLDGQFVVQQLEIMEIAVTEITITTQARNGIVKISPVAMKLLDGQFNASLTLDVNQLPDYSITASAKNLHAGPVVDPIIQELMGNNDVRLKGATRFDANIRTRGGSVNALKQVATGRVNFDMNQTSLVGVDIEHYTRGVVLDYLDQKQDLIEIPDAWRGEYQPKPETAFDKIHASAVLGNGKVTNRDFIMDSKHIKVTGEGVVDIMDNTMDYNALVDLSLSRTKTTAEKLLDEPLGVHIHGPFAQLAIEPDLKHLGRLATKMAKDKLKATADKKLEEQKARLKAKADAEKKAAQQKLEQEKQKAKEEAKDKLKDKLKGLF